MVVDYDEASGVSRGPASPRLRTALIGRVRGPKPPRLRLGLHIWAGPRLSDVTRRRLVRLSMGSIAKCHPVA